LTETNKISDPVPVAVFKSIDVNAVNDRIFEPLAGHSELDRHPTR
jgi:hypothetical protein